MVNTVEGIKDGRQRTVTTSLLIQRDLNTGLMAMSMGVAYPACIAAEMVVSGEIPRRGVLSPAVDLPSGTFLRRLKEMGIAVNETVV